MILFATFRDTSSRSSSVHSDAEESAERILKWSTLIQQNASDGLDLECKSSSSSCDNVDGPVNCAVTDQNVLQPVIPYVESSDIETTDTDRSTRRSSRRRTPNRKYANDYISPTINQRRLATALSPKRHLSSSSDSIAVDSKRNPTHDQHKKLKRSAATTSEKGQHVFSKPPRVPKPQCTVELGTLVLKWPKYGINNGIYEGQSFSVTRTCSIDTGLFALYHAYKVGNDKFQKFFDNDNLDALVVLRETFRYVETRDWTVARLHWLVRYQLLNEKTLDGRYDLENTLTKIVFDYVRPMQVFDIISECSCVACSQRIRKTTSVDITLR